MGSSMLEATKSPRSRRVSPPSSATKPMTMRKDALDWVTLIPCWRTTPGKRGSARLSLFWTWTWAMSGSEPRAKVRAMVALPDESLLEDMYWRPSRPVICCSMTCTTVFRMVSADAPG